MLADVTFNSNTLFNMINLLITVVAFIYLTSFKFAKMEVKVDTMWYFQMRRGLLEIESKGLGKTRSPMRINSKANEVIAPLVPELKNFYRHVNGDKMPLITLAVEIEKNFGQQLSQTVCSKLDISNGACLVLAIAQLRPIGFQILKDLEVKAEVKGGFRFPK